MDIFIIYLLITAQFFSDRYTTTDPVWSFWLGRYCDSWGFPYSTSTTVVLNHFAPLPFNSDLPAL